MQVALVAPLALGEGQQGPLMQVALVALDALGEGQEGPLGPRPDLIPI